MHHHWKPTVGHASLTGTRSETDPGFPTMLRTSSKHPDNDDWIENKNNYSAVLA